MKYIYDKLKNIKKEDLTYFCMPGHKQNKDFLKDFHTFIDFDCTEIEDTDNMHIPKDIIKNAMEEVAKTFKAKYSFFLVNGSTIGVMASIMASVKYGDNVLIAKNCHISVYNALILSGANPIYIEPTIKYGLYCGINLSHLEKVLNNFNIKAFVLTSPTYEGFVSDIGKIKDITRSKNVILILDEAHAPHFIFSDKFPSTNNRPDIAIHSFHKTMPSLTQCGVLHIYDDFLIDVDRLKKCLCMLQTTSPSYIFMLSIEYANDFCKNNMDLFDIYTTTLLNIRKELKSLKKIELIDVDILKNSDIIDFDISRFTFLINSNTLGFEVNNILRKLGIQIEMFSKHHIIAISTICDTMQSLDKFKNAIIKLDNMLTYKYIERESLNIFKINIPTLTPREIFYTEKKLIPFTSSVNYISYNDVAIYPPGMPTILSGELITQKHINAVQNALNNNLDVLGIILKNNNVYIYVKI